MNRTIVVTGASGFVGNHSVVRLLDDGETVRAVVRNAAGKDLVLQAVAQAEANAAGLEFVTATLDDESGWDSALEGADGVLHHASPFPAAEPDDPEHIIRPARDGALRVLAAARRQNVRRVVLTSSFAAVGYSRHSGEPYTEADWTDGEDTSLPAYIRSKALAERAAWKFAADGGPELVVVNPTGIFGPALSPKLSVSVEMVAALRSGQSLSGPGRPFTIVDVRDVVELHLRALDAPEAVGRRFIASSGVR